MEGKKPNNILVNLIIFSYYSPLKIIQLLGKAYGSERMVIRASN